MSNLTHNGMLRKNLFLLLDNSATFRLNIFAFVMFLPIVTQEISVGDVDYTYV